MEPTLSDRRVWLAAVAAFFIFGGATYFAGTMNEHAGRVRDAAAAREKYAARDAQFQSAEASIASLQSASKLLAADVWVCRAAVALDNRNFGVADGAVANAVANLSKVDAASAGLDATSLQKVNEQAAAIHISVATNLESQRTELLRLENDIGGLVAKSRPMLNARP